MDERCLIDVRGLYELLLDHMGPTHWWPADTRFEIAIGAILTQNTAWGNVETALDRMKAADVLNARSIADLPDETLWDLIRSTGYYRQKAVYLRAFCQWFLDLGEWSHDDDIPALVREVDGETLRRELLSIRGVGGETADDLLLYVFDRPAFIADRYARRMFETLGVDDLPKSYEGFRRRVMPQIDADAWSIPEFQEFHGLIDELGKTCRTPEDWNHSIVAGYRMPLP